MKADADNVKAAAATLSGLKKRFAATGIAPAFIHTVRLLRAMPPKDISHANFLLLLSRAQLSLLILQTQQGTTPPMWFMTTTTQLRSSLFQRQRPIEMLTLCWSRQTKRVSLCASIIRSIYKFGWWSRLYQIIHRDAIHCLWNRQRCSCQCGHPKCPLDNYPNFD